MAYFKFQNIKISCVASAVPMQVVTGEDFYVRFGEEAVKKFQESTGVKQFRKTKEHQTASDRFRPLLCCGRKYHQDQGGEP